MAIRALIIAIESYPDVQGGAIAKNLPGTLQAGLAFRKWLVEKWAAEGHARADTQLILCSEPKQPDGSGARRGDIVDALLSLKAAGQGTTEELWVFFSGHGFSFVEGVGSRADVLISSDFQDAQRSGPSCLKLGEVIAWLRAHLGPGRHYYFVDACRNHLNPSQIQVGTLPPIDPQSSAEASTFLLQSTADGAMAAVGGPFPTALLDGLHGKGNAKAWDARVSDAMLVRYDSLRSYVKARLKTQQAITSKTEGPEGDTDVVLATIRPIPLSNCTINIRNASNQDHGEVSIMRNRSSASTRQQLKFPSLNLSLEPDIYILSVELQDASVSPSGPIRLDLFDDQTVTFDKVPATLALGGIEPTTLAEVEVIVPAGNKVTVRNLDTGDERPLSQTVRLKLLDGRYSATMRSTRDHILKKLDLDLEAGQPSSIDLAKWPTSAPHVAIATRLPHSSHGVDFSESLQGPVTDPDLDLWLALVGGSRILGPRGDYSKLAGFPLHQFLNEPPGGSPIYVLAGFEDPNTRLKIALSVNPEVQWNDAAQPPGMSGIREAFFSAPAGSQLLSFCIGEGVPYTVATFATANRCTLITITLDEDGYPRVSQYMLPLGHLLDELAPEVQTQLQYRNHLADVRFLAQASRAFRERRNLTTDVPGHDLNELLFAKWLDPIASSLAAYELLRRGDGRYALRDVVANMKRYFNDLPDTASLAKLSGDPGVAPSGVPLFFDGLRAFPNYAEWLPLPAGQLDFSSLWTAWWAAVRS